MSFTGILLLMLPIIIISLAGYCFSFFKKSEPKILADLIIYVTAPALFILSLSTTKFEASELVTIILTAAAVILLTFAFLKALNKKYPLPSGLYLSSMFMNSGFIGLPIILMAYGFMGLSRAIVYDVTNGILIYSLGIFIISGKTDKWQVFKTPILYSAAIGIALNILNVKLPDFLGVTLAMLGNSTIPLALFLVGVHLGRTKITSLKLPIVSVLIRFSLGVGISFVIVKVFNIPQVLGNILIIMSSLPSAINAIVLTDEYKKNDSALAASAIAISTIMAIIYLPLLITFLK